MVNWWRYSFAEVEKLITENGGRLGDLNEPKLTHVVLDRRDESRRLELIKRTSKYVEFCSVDRARAPDRFYTRPKRRHLIISEYILTCLDEGTLLNEEGKFDCRKLAIV